MEMRRKDRARDEAFSLALIDRCTHGVMALTTGTDTPYCLPLSLVRVDRALYFHCAHQGRKVELMRTCPKVCVTFIGGDSPAYLDKGEYTTYFQSVIAFGTIRILEDDGEKMEAIQKLAVKYAPEETPADRQNAIDREWAPLCMLEMRIDHLTGKMAKELIKRPL